MTVTHPMPASLRSCASACAHSRGCVSAGGLTDGASVCYHARMRGKQKQSATGEAGVVGASRNGSPPYVSPEAEAGIPIPPSTPSVPEVISPPKPYDFAHCDTRLNHNGPYNPDDVVAAIRATGGNFLEMSALLGRRRNAVRDYVYANIEIKDVWDEVRECFLDETEQALKELVGARDAGTIKFVLSTLGRARGYTPKIELGGQDNSPLKFEVVLADGTGVAELQAKPPTIDQIADDLMRRGIPVGKDS